jgi:hypothetical protein
LVLVVQVRQLKTVWQPLAEAIQVLQVLHLRVVVVAVIVQTVQVLVAVQVVVAHKVAVQVALEQHHPFKVLTAVLVAQVQ